MKSIFANSKSINLSNLISLESIIIGDNCFRQVKSFELNGLNNLKSLTIGYDSFGNTESMNLSNLISLESIIIGENCFRQVKSFELNGLNKLKSLRIGNKPYTQNTYGSHSFYETTSDLKCDESKSFHILNCESLTSIEIGSYCFSDFNGVFKLEHLNSLRSITIGTRKQINRGYGIFDMDNSYYSHSFCGSSLDIRGINIILSV